MPAVYLDTSALGRVLLGEPDAPAVVHVLGHFEQHVSSRLLAVELRRLAIRHERRNEANELLHGLALVPVAEEILADAEALPPPSVATLDAVHLATALQLARAGLLDALLTFDARLAEGARYHDLEVLTPA